ncbi:phage fiber-tail adaptor protein [Govanella unica]|uniref:Uncharacterized protein n=1 Tax=Govanella unica TaxID=2975056 RepID=A0A9X3TZQ0_9PROT|nr:hypothetical protein [Govania unica]MDA5194945.1 hypothetical protein [Govania unica]
MAVLVKDPEARLDYAIDWSDYLDMGETIVESLWEVTPAESLSVFVSEHGDSRSQVTLEGGTVRDIYAVTNRITTSLGRIDDRSLTIRVQER